MSSTLPFLTLPPAVSAVTATAGADTAALSSGGEFAALLGAQLPSPPQGLLETPTVDAAAQALATATGMPLGAAKQALANLDETTLRAIANAAASLAAQAGAPANAETATPPIMVVPAGPPVAAPSESQLTQAVGGEDKSAEAADAAIAAALNLGVAPMPSQRLVLAAALPTTVQTSASVRVLDQLLDSFLPNPLGGMPQGGATKTADTTGSANSAPVSPSPATASAATSIAQAMGANKPATPGPLSAAAAASSEPSATVTRAPTATASQTLASVAPATPASFTITATTAAAAPLASAAHEATDQDAPAFTPGTPPKGEPAALNNGKAAPRAVDALRQRLEPLGLSGDIAVTIQQTANAGTLSTASGQANPAAPGAAVALAAQGAASSLQATGQPAGGANPAPGLGHAGAMVAAMPSETQGFFGQSQSEGGWSNDGGLYYASGSTDALASYSDDTGAQATGFGSLLTSQGTLATASRTPGVALPQAPHVPPTLPDQVAVQIAAAARNGEQQIAVQLRPASLGRVEIQLSIGRDGAVRARVTAERSETLDLLQRDARGLETAIEAAGLRAETGGLSFSLKDGGGQNGQPSFADTPLPASLLATLEGERTPFAQLPDFRALDDGRALDIRV